MAPCGLYCEDCNIFRATTDEDARQKVIARLEARGIRNIDPKSIGCHGCPGDGGLHWAPGCEILECTRVKGHVLCSECAEFACEKLLKWGETMATHGEALSRLRQSR
jgi:hypothetical protein